MATSNREAAISKTLQYEGGYTNHPADPGGPTNWGITIADARMYWKKDATAADVKAMPKSVAIEIYRKHYWDAMKCDSLPAGVDLAVFDFGVNSGVSRSLAYYAACPKTDPVATVQVLCDKRLAFLKGLRTWATFGKGWNSRVVDVKAVAVKMARTGTLVPTGHVVEPTVGVGHTDAPKVAPAPAPAPKTPVLPKAPLDPHKSAGSFLNTLYTLVQGFLKRKS